MLILIQSSLVISSIALLWRSTLTKNKNMGKYLKNIFPIFLGKALTCGLCFTYWVALFFALFYEPINFAFFQFNNFENFIIKYISHVFLSWMLVGFISVSLRFLFVFLQEKVNQLYSTNNGGAHNH